MIKCAIKENYAGRILLSSKGFSEKASKQWMNRHIRDPYVRASREMNYRSRAAFKLLGIDSKYNLMKPGMKVLEIGSAPGSWTQVITKKVHSTNEKPTVIAIDVLKMQPVAGSIFIHGSIFSKTTDEKIQNALGGEKVSLVCSDAAPEFVGDEEEDREATIELHYAVLDTAIKYLNNGGCFLMKTMQGWIEKKMKVEIKQNFEWLTYAKPPASRTDSREVYILAKGFSSGIEKKKEEKKEVKKEVKVVMKKLDLSKSSIEKDTIRKAILRYSDRKKQTS